MVILKDKVFIFILIISFFIRLAVALLPGFKIDIEDWAAWAIRLNETGFNHFYSQQVFTDYTPGYLYVLNIIGWIRESFILNNFIFFYLLKIPAIISEILIGIIIYQEIFRSLNRKAATIAAAIILFNPALIFNSSLWGQVDSVSTLFVLLTIISLKKNKLIISSLFFSVAFLIKPQTAIIFPVLIYFIIKNFSFKNLLKLFFPALLLTYLLSLPFFPIQTLTNLIQHITNSANVYPYNSLFAYNFWGAIGFWANDNQLFGSFNFKEWGILLLVGYLIILTYFYFKKNINLYSMTALICLGFFFLPTRVHERYLYPAIPLLVLAGAYLKSKIIYLLTLILCFIHFLNLYYVYIYYNEFYFNLPKTIYNPMVYNFLGEQSKNLSVLSTILFILIFVIVIKDSYENKKIQS